MGVSRIRASAAALANWTRPSPMVAEAMLNDPAAAPGVAGQYIVTGAWGGNYAVPAGGVAIAVGDVAEWDAGLAGYRRLALNVGGFVAAGTTFVVAAVPGGGLAALANQIVTADGAGGYAGVVPPNGQQIITTGTNSATRGQNFIYSTALAAWYASGILNIPLSNQVYVDVAGNDLTGIGTIERPFATPAVGMAAAGAGGTVICGPGAYAVGTLTIITQVNFKALVPGTVTFTGTVAAGAVVEATGAAINPVLDGINITNASAAGAAAIALLVDNALGTITGTVTFKNGNLTSGAGVSTAFQVIGDAGGPNTTLVLIEDAVISGSWDIGLVVATDTVTLRNVTDAGGAGLVAWAQVAGALGTVRMENFKLLTGATEVLDFGGGAASGIVFSIRNSRIAGTLDLDNLAGTGYIEIDESSHIEHITKVNAAVADQAIRKLLGGNEIEFGLYGVDLNGIAAHVMANVGAGRAFNPYAFRSYIAAASGALLVYQVDGTGAASTVAAVGPAALAAGVTVEACLQDVIAGVGTVQVNITTASGAADLANFFVRGILT